MAKEDKGEDEDLLEEAREHFKKASDAEDDNRRAALDDIRFARLGGEEQWPETARKIRGNDRPMITINKMNAFIRQVVNDSRQNKPSIKVHPVDDVADPKTAEVISGLIRNIEYTSNADVAYDTAVECAVAGGLGYLRVDLEYSHDDTFDMDLLINRISNPFSVYGDPNATSVDGSDWNEAFVVDHLTKDEFEARYGNEKEKIDWEAEFKDISPDWFDGEMVQIAEWWRREEVERPICLLSDGTVISKEKIGKEYFLLEGVEVKAERIAKSFKVTQYFISGVEILDTVEWKGKYIPIIPVIGDEVDVEGKRHFRSLIRDAKDPQRNYNYWTTTAAELVALAPRVPYIGKKGFAQSDQNWETANTGNHPYLEYDGDVSPQRQPIDSGPAAGALQQALVANDEMKSVLGIYDASLGARSNETSGKAIMARQREGDVSTFHFADNLSRSIRHTGRVLIDLIPAVYSKERIIRVLGEDGSHDMIPLGQPTPIKGPDGNPQMQPMQGPDGRPMINPMTQQPEMIPVTHVYDLGAGKYDLTVTSGPSFTTRREEAAREMTEMVRAMPSIGPLVMDLLAKNLDWPGADELAKRFKAMLPPQAQGGPSPEVQKITEQAKQAVAQLQEALKKASDENQKLKAENQAIKSSSQVDMMQAQIDEFRAMTDRMQVMMEAVKPQPQPANGELR